jgi:hypothetical protein
MFLCNWLVVWSLEQLLNFSPLVGMMIQSGELIFFRGGSTTNQVTMLNELWLVMANEKTSQSDVATSPE